MPVDPTVIRSFGIGAQGAHVRDLQGRLISLGHSSGLVDGTFGESTKSALERFQAQRSIDVDGICGPQTWDQLVEAGHRLGSRLLYLQVPALRGDDVAELQRLLTTLGFPMGHIDGIHGELTASSMADFQLNAGLVPDGVCGSITIDGLHRVANRFGGSTDITRLREQHKFSISSHRLNGYKILLAETGGLDAIVASLRRNLTDAGAEVLTAHHPDWSSHARQANSFGADFCIGVEVREGIPSICHFLGNHFESPTGKQIGDAISSNLQELFPGITSTGMRLPLLRETQMPALLCRLSDVNALVRSHQSMSKIITHAIRGLVQKGLE